MLGQSPMICSLFRIIQFKVQIRLMKKELKYAISLNMSNSQQFVYFTNHARRIVNL
ncbi:hypothetical protein THF1C08_30080 [Vibrio jasicida]|uniref:Uncharacterized protein n=1 Tax=Vibrio jasicida TaxID=766224 RepID=A0AAU9QRP4_9VIBR|nr:hypothetical protein THF1C08_30080 [Vibrio jasicida]CAH1599938.1 hypothetical protein THF1A12_40356 [Vibrio jasicida]